MVSTQLYVDLALTPRSALTLQRPRDGVRQGDRSGRRQGAGREPADEGAPQQDRQDEDARDVGDARDPQSEERRLVLVRPRTAHPVILLPPPLARPPARPLMPLSWSRSMSQRSISAQIDSFFRRFFYRYSRYRNWFDWSATIENEAVVDFDRAKLLNAKACFFNHGVDVRFARVFTLVDLARVDVRRRLPSVNRAYAWSPSHLPPPPPSLTLASLPLAQSPLPNLVGVSHLQVYSAVEISTECFAPALITMLCTTDVSTRHPPSPPPSMCVPEVM